MKQGSYGHKMELKKTAYDVLSPKIRKQLNTDILDEFKELCGIKTLHSGNYQPVDEEIALSHLIRTHAGPRGELQYSLYFGENWKQIPWNKIVVSNKAAAVFGALDDAGKTVDLSSEVMQAIIWSFVVQVQGAYKRSLPHADENEAEADARCLRYCSASPLSCNNGLLGFENGTQGNLYGNSERFNHIAGHAFDYSTYPVARFMVKAKWRMQSECGYQLLLPPDTVLMQEKEGARYWVRKLDGVTPWHFLRGGDSSVSSDKAWDASIALQISVTEIRHFCRRYHMSWPSRLGKDSLRSYLDRWYQEGRWQTQTMVLVVTIHKSPRRSMILILNYMELGRFIPSTLGDVMKHSELVLLSEFNETFAELIRRPNAQAFLNYNDMFMQTLAATPETRPPQSAFGFSTQLRNPSRSKHGDRWSFQLCIPWRSSFYWSTSTPMMFVAIWDRRVAKALDFGSISHSREFVTIMKEYHVSLSLASEIKCDLQSLGQLLDLPVFLCGMESSVKKPVALTLRNDLEILFWGVKRNNELPGAPKKRMDASLATHLDIVLQLAEGKEVYMHSAILRAHSVYFEDFLGDELERAVELSVSLEKSRCFEALWKKISEKENLLGNTLSSTNLKAFPSPLENKRIWRRRCSGFLTTSSNPSPKYQGASANVSHHTCSTVSSMRAEFHRKVPPIDGSRSVL
ncbi:hypothetical protein D9758_013799 [Tetrapyrgos nigripes]|uniref:BTB domain-containing protein n=1 Tax=Tetrapyrgos nigripes TaxID=182062 RepID=A0A8H5D5I2_9AGAR|nr:hypothetical protein D9758_013799 [Tetrapyrgos nigripes]